MTWRKYMYITELTLSQSNIFERQTKHYHVSRPVWF